jgi:hypothetical protein
MWVSWYFEGSPKRVPTHGGGFVESSGVFTPKQVLPFGKSPTLLPSLRGEPERLAHLGHFAKPGVHVAGEGVAADVPGRTVLANPHLLVPPPVGGERLVALPDNPVPQIPKRIVLEALLGLLDELRVLGERGRSSPLTVARCWSPRLPCRRDGISPRCRRFGLPTGYWHSPPCWMPKSQCHLERRAPGCHRAA